MANQKIRIRLKAYDYSLIDRSAQEGVEMVMPGENVTITVELIAPIAMEDGLRFAIREGGRTVGAGVVSTIIA